jgi:hypothetical protein
MKNLLIYPYFLENRVHNAEDAHDVPLGVYYIAVVLKENHYDTEVLNCYNINETPLQMEEYIENIRRQ